MIFGLDRTFPEVWLSKWMARHRAAPSLSPEIENPMRLTMLAMALLTSVAAAQIGIPAHNNVYVGYTRGFNFTAQSAFTISGLDLPMDAFQAGDTAAYAVRINGVSVYNSFGNAGPVAVSLPVVPNDIVDIVGN
ncbi:MAG: hypothetical protein JNK15_12325 [Planctomycetes bacterium]|nr:hypothetical protein [Planctomycetota bacterium]